MANAVHNTRVVVRAFTFVGLVQNESDLLIVMPTSALVALTPNYLDPTIDGNGDFLAQKLRAFSERRMANAAEYQTYVAKMVGGARPGATPTIFTWIEQPLEVARVPGLPGVATVTLHTDMAIEILDGATQRIARERAALANERVADSSVSMRVLHGISRADAGQIFHDLNTLGVVASRSEALALDAEDPATRITHQLAAMPVLAGRVCAQGKSLSRRDQRHYVMFSALRLAVVCTLLGRGGLQLGSAPIARRHRAEEFDAAAPHVVDIWTKFFQAHERDFVSPRRSDTIVSSPAVMGALGVLFNAAMPKPFHKTEQPLTAEHVLDLLVDVQWGRAAITHSGPDFSRWGEIAGKLRDNKLSLGGPNEYSRQILNALASPDTPEGKRIRIADETPRIEASTMRSSTLF